MDQLCLVIGKQVEVTTLLNTFWDTFTQKVSPCLRRQSFIERFVVHNLGTVHHKVHAFSILRLKKLI